jgi:hypothetical protein
MKRIHQSKQNVLAASDTWEWLIEQATAKLQHHESQASKLRVAIEHFERRKASGDPFPGLEKLKEKGLVSPNEAA